MVDGTKILYGFLRTKISIVQNLIEAIKGVLLETSEISVRIFLNIGKKHLFFSRFNQKVFYDGYVENIRTLFSNVVDNLRKTYLKEAAEKLVPIRDYQPMYLVICNIPYVKFKNEEK